MEKQRIRCEIIIIVMSLVMLSVLSIVNAEKRNFHGVGEYTMSDYETPEVAERRAFSYAMDRAAEQAGVYVETYTRMEKMQVTEDNVKSLASSTLRVIERKTEKKALPSGDVRIVAYITAEVDTDDIEKIVMVNNKDKEQYNMEMYRKISDEIRGEEQKIIELKSKISELKNENLSTDELKIEVKVKEKQFLADEKIKQWLDFQIRGEYRKALEIAESAVGYDPKYAGAYFARGSSYAGLGYNDNAIEEYNKAMMLGVDQAWFCVFLRGNAYARKEDYDKSIKDYSTVLELNPAFEDAYINRGISYEKKGDYDKALSDYSRVITINPNNKDAYITRGLMYFTMGDYQKAFSDANRILTIDSREYMALWIRGSVYIFEEQYELGIRDLKRLISIKPDFEPARKLLQMVYSLLKGN